VGISVVASSIPILGLDDDLLQKFLQEHIWH